MPERRIGFACGTLTAGLTAGILLGSLIATGVNKRFAAGRSRRRSRGAFRSCSAACSASSRCILRRLLHETPVFEEMQQRNALAAEIAAARPCSRGHGRAVVISMLLTWVLTAAIVVVILMTPTLLQKQFHIAAGDRADRELPRDAVPADRLRAVGLRRRPHRRGARRFSIGGIALAIAYYALYLGNWPWIRQCSLPWYAFTGFCVGVVGVIPFVMVQAFPAAVRFSGISFSYNVAYAIFGGLTPIVVVADDEIQSAGAGALCRGAVRRRRADDAFHP